MRLASFLRCTDCVVKSKLANLTFLPIDKPTLLHNVPQLIISFIFVHREAVESAQAGKAILDKQPHLLPPRDVYYDCGRGQQTQRHGAPNTPQHRSNHVALVVAVRHQQDTIENRGRDE